MAPYPVARRSGAERDVSSVAGDGVSRAGVREARGSDPGRGAGARAARHVRDQGAGLGHRHRPEGGGWRLGRAHRGPAGRELRGRAGRIVAVRDRGDAGEPGRAAGGELEGGRPHVPEGVRLLAGGDEAAARGRHLRAGAAGGDVAERPHVRHERRAHAGRPQVPGPHRHGGPGAVARGPGAAGGRAGIPLDPRDRPVCVPAPGRGWPALAGRRLHDRPGVRPGLRRLGHGHRVWSRDDRFERQLRHHDPVGGAAVGRATRSLPAVRGPERLDAHPARRLRGAVLVAHPDHLELHGLDVRRRRAVPEFRGRLPAGAHLQQHAAVQPLVPDAPRHRAALHHPPVSRLREERLVPQP